MVNFSLKSIAAAAIVLLGVVASSSFAVHAAPATGVDAQAVNAALVSAKLAELNSLVKGVDPAIFCGPTFCSQCKNIGGMTGDACTYQPAPITSTTDTLNDAATIFLVQLPWTDLRRITDEESIPGSPTTTLTVLKISRRACRNSHAFMRNGLPTLVRAAADLGPTLLSVIYCSIDQQPRPCAHSSKELASKSAPVDHLYWFATVSPTARDAYKRLPHAMPEPGVSTVLPFVMVFETVTGRAMTVNVWHELPAAASPADCLREWTGGEEELARRTQAGGLLGGQIPWTALAPGVDLAPLVVIAFVTVDVKNGACREAMAAVTKFIAQAPEGKVSLIVVPVAKIKVEKAAAAAWSEVLRVRVPEVVVYNMDEVAWAPHDLVEKLEVRPAVLVVAKADAGAFAY
ncbi:hypothetical protein GGF32_004005 [Allomyces javanicus]|nr:hypothetical protein GGF32_004005 [Allomyces javanicus]